MAFQHGAFQSSGFQDVVPVAAAVSAYSGGSYNFLNPRRYRVDDDDEEERKPVPLEIVKIGDAPQRQIITGIVEPFKRANPKPATTTKSLSQAQMRAENERAERIRRNIAASNEWLLLS